MKGLKALEVFDKTIDVITSSGIMVFLNNHTSKAQWCCSMTDGDGLWWNKQYPEEKYFECLEALAKRYKGNPRVIGMDVRNEIRPNKELVPNWGTGIEPLDWQMAAEKVGNRIQAIAPHWLIIIGGLDYQLDLKPIVNKPVKLKVPNKVVYSGHIYSFSWPEWNDKKWQKATYDEFYNEMREKELLVREAGYPFLLGEFGTNSRNKFWQYLMRLLKETNIDWTYWCLDGYKCLDQEDETYGLLTKDFKHVRYGWACSDLKEVGRPQASNEKIKEVYDEE